MITSLAKLGTGLVKLGIDAAERGLRLLLWIVPFAVLACGIWRLALIRQESVFINDISHVESGIIMVSVLVIFGLIAGIIGHMMKSGTGTVIRGLGIRASAFAAMACGAWMLIPLCQELIRAMASAVNNGDIAIAIEVFTTVAITCLLIGSAFTLALGTENGWKLRDFLRRAPFACWCLITYNGTPIWAILLLPAILVVDLVLTIMLLFSLLGLGLWTGLTAKLGDSRPEQPSNVEDTVKVKKVMQPPNKIGAVFHHAVIVESLPEGTIPCYYKVDGVPAVVINKESLTPETIVKVDRIVVPLLDSDLNQADQVDEDTLGFSALEAASAMVDPSTGTAFNTTRIVSHLDYDNLSDAYREIESRNLRVARLFMNPKDYYTDIHYFESPTPSRPNCGIVAKLWGAEVIVSNTVDVGTVYVCADKESLGVMPKRSGRVGICIHNPRAVVSITIDRELYIARHRKLGRSVCARPYDEGTARRAGL